MKTILASAPQVSLAKLFAVLVFVCIGVCGLSQQTYGNNLPTLKMQHITDPTSFNLAPWQSTLDITVPFNSPLIQAIRVKITDENPETVKLIVTSENQLLVQFVHVFPGNAPDERLINFTQQPGQMGFSALRVVAFDEKDASSAEKQYITFTVQEPSFYNVNAAAVNANSLSVSILSPLSFVVPPLTAMSFQKVAPSFTWPFFVTPNVGAVNVTDATVPVGLNNPISKYIRFSYTSSTPGIIKNAFVHVFNGQYLLKMTPFSSAVGKTNLTLTFAYGGGRNPKIVNKSVEVIVSSTATMSKVAALFQSAIAPVSPTGVTTYAKIFKTYHAFPQIFAYGYNSELIEDANVTTAPDGITHTLTVTGKAGKTGKSDIAVIMTNGNTWSENSFSLTIAEPVVLANTSDGIQETQRSTQKTLPLETITATTYPNPVSDMISVDYTLKNPEYVSVDLYTASGRKVATLFEGFQESGNHTVNGTTSTLQTGTYVCRVQTRTAAKSTAVSIVR